MPDDKKPEIDFSKYASSGLTEADLIAQAQQSAERRTGFKEGAWVKFRVVGQRLGVASCKNRDGSPKIPKDCSGSKLVFETLHALTAKGTLSVDTEDVKHIIVLWDRTNPELLKASGYSEEQIAAVGKRGAPNTYDMVRERFGAVDNKKFYASQKADGTWDKTQEEIRKAVIAFQAELYGGKAKLVGNEVFALIGFETFNGYQNVKLKGFRHKDNPPRERDGSFTKIADPDSGAPF